MHATPHRLRMSAYSGKQHLNTPSAYGQDCLQAIIVLLVLEVPTSMRQRAGVQPKCSLPTWQQQENLSKLVKLTTSTYGENRLLNRMAPKNACGNTMCDDLQRIYQCNESMSIWLLHSLLFIYRKLSSHHAIDPGTRDNPSCCNVHHISNLHGQSMSTSATPAV